MQTNLQMHMDRMNARMNAKVRSRKRRFLFYKWVATLICGAIAFSPAIVFFVLKNVLNPQDFWQKLVVYGGGIVFLGTTQLGFLVIYIGALINVIWND